METSILNNFLIVLISILHLIIILFILIVPFSDSNYLLFMYCIVIPFIILHWILNNNMCCLTVAENYIRNITNGTKINIQDNFTYKLIAPIYDFNKNHQQFSIIIYIVTLLLWSIAMSNLTIKYNSGQIKTFNDIIII